jgi:hypothetical protein
VPANAAVVRAVFLTAGRPTLVRASAIAAAVGVAGSIVFAGSGMPTRDLVHLFHASSSVRAALWIGWTIAATPAVASAFDAPGTRMVRALRVPSVRLVAALLVLFACVEVPWALLFAFGGGALQAWTMTWLAVAMQVSLVVLRAHSRSGWMALLPVVLAAWDEPMVVAAPISFAVAAIAVRVAWVRGLEKGRGALRMTRPMPAVLALALTHLLRLVRSERVRLLLAGFGTATGCGFLSLSLRNDPAPHPVQRAATVMALPLTLAAAVLAPPLLDVERRLRPWLVSLRVRPAAVLAAFLLALGTPSSALAAGAGAIAGAVVSAGTPTASGTSITPAALACALAVASWASTGAVGGWARLHDRSRTRNPIAFALGAVAIAVALMGAAQAW